MNDIEPVILVTGATSGIGRKTLEVLLQNGYQCVLIARREEVMLAISSEMKRKYGKTPYYFKYDLCDLENISKIFEFLEKNGILLSGFVHCAGVAPYMKIVDNSVGVMLETYKINLFSFIEISKNVLNPKYSVDGASIIAISSVVADNVTFGQSVYASSKAALNSIIKNCAKEGLSRKIRVNSIMPGNVDTEMLTNLLATKKNKKEILEKNNPLGIILPEEIAEMILYLLSEKGKHISGSSFTIDAGYGIR